MTAYSPIEAARLIVEARDAYRRHGSTLPGLALCLGALASQLEAACGEIEEIRGDNASWEAQCDKHTATINSLRQDLLAAKSALRAILPVYRAAAGLAYPYAQLAYLASRRTIAPEISEFLDGLEDK